MKNIVTRLTFLGLFVVYLFLLSNSSGGPAGTSGAPEEETCGRSGCHNVMPNLGSATASINFNDGQTTFKSGETYKVKIAIENPQNANRNGFQIVALDGQNANIGQWNLSGDDTKMKSGNMFPDREYVTQTTSGSGQSSWEMDWVAPNVDTGTITFYLAYNDANANGGKTGDDIYTISLPVSPDSATTRINEIETLHEIQVFPNPFENSLTLVLDLDANTDISISIINTLGQTVIEEAQENLLQGKNIIALDEVNNLEKGLYFVKLESASGGVNTVRIFKN